MNLKYMIYIMFIATATLLTAGCIDQEQATEKVGVVPTDNLPEGFQLIAIQNSTYGLDEEEEIEDFVGDEDIGEIQEITKGIYKWGVGNNYDANVIVVEAQNENYAKAAIANYVTQPDFERPPLQGVDRFSTAFVNGHEVIEIRDKVDKNEIKYLFIWTNENKVVLVKGNNNLASSLELAKATGL